MLSWEKSTRPDYGIAEIQKFHMIFSTPGDIVKPVVIFGRLDENAVGQIHDWLMLIWSRTIVFRVRSWSLWRIYAARLIGKRILEHVQNQYDLSLSRARKEMRNHKASQSCNWIKWGRRGPTQSAQWQIRRAIIFYIRLASFQLTPAYGRQRLRGYRGRVQFPTLLLF